MMRDIELTDVTHTSTFLEKGELFLSIEGRTEKGKFIIPKISLKSLFEHETTIYCNSIDSVLIEFIPDEKPPKEMTIAEIQKELGYKIKIKE